jgi:hypothetical protein
MNWSTCIDWLSFSIPAEAGIDRFPVWYGQHQPVHPHYGYDCGVIFDTGVLMFSHSTKPEMGILIQYGGEALRNLFPLSPLHVLTYHAGSGHKAKRIDIALDVFDCLITAGEIERLFNVGSVKTRAKQGTLVRQDMQRRGEGYYIGSLTKRKKLLRCYDKGAEQGVERDWFRFELQCSDTAAPAAVETLYTRGDNPDILIGMITGYALIPLPQLKELFDVPALKTPHRYEPKPNSDIEAAMRTIPVWIARLMLKYSPYVLDAILEQVALEYHRLNPAEVMNIVIERYPPDKY